MSRSLLPKQDGEENRQADADGVEKEGDDAGRAEGLSRHVGDKVGGKEELDAVGQEALREAGDGIQNRGRTLRLNVIVLGNASGNRTSREDSHRIVGGADVHQAYQGTDAEFGTSLGVDTPSHMSQQEIDAAIRANEFQEASCHDSHQYHFAHADHAVAEVIHPTEQTESATPHADDARKQDAQQQYQDNVQTHQRDDDDYDVGENQQKVNGMWFLKDLGIFAQEKVDTEHQERHRQDEAEVGAELILHLASLTLGGRDGGVADEREIVAEIGATHYNSYHERHADVRLEGNAHGNRGELDDGTN